MSASTQASLRRMLLDIQIGDWDERFLSRLDAEALVSLYRDTGVDSVMFYCQSHLGLCYWPTQSGKVHRAFRERDFVAEMLTLLKKHQLQACGYSSVIYNNWAFLEHLDWRVVPAAAVQLHKLPSARYGHCCPNHPDYHAFVMTQIEELLSGYEFDSFFFDMVWWPTICVCASCRERYRRETGQEIPQVIDWHSADWCRFQAQRETWMSEFAGELRAKVHSLRPDVTVYHNFAVCLFNWTRGLSFASAVQHDFLGGDFYGDPLEQHLVSRLMVNLTETRPAEFMTTKCTDLTEPVRLKSAEQVQLQAYAATASSAAFLVIDTVAPDGAVHAEPYRHVAAAFAKTRPYEPYLGGEPVEDIGVYFSSGSKMNFKENGLPLRQAPVGNHAYPHVCAVRGACDKLQRAHLPFGVMTRKQLSELSRYAIVVLPNVLRMDEEEVEAFRVYVHQGGCLYASRYTSLTSTAGQRHEDFILADLFGCHFAAPESGRVAYLQPRAGDLREVIAPQQYVSHWNDPGLLTGTLHLQDRVEGETLATLTLAYGHPHTGSVQDTHWASIHTFPPWESTPIPLIVKNRFGSGEVI